MKRHEDLDFTTIDECRGSEIVQAVERLAAAQTRGAVKLRVNNRPPLDHVVVDYEPRPAVVRITGYGKGMPATALALQVENGLNPWAATAAWPDGEVRLRLCASTRTIWFDDSDSTDEPRVEYPTSGPWKRIEGRGRVPDDVHAAIHAIADELAIVGADDCVGTAANCTRYANKVLAAGFLCALSFGGDTDSCRESHDAHCQWCSCKGYNCPSCD